MRFTFILLAGGIGTRVNSSIPKQYMLLAGKPMIMHVLEKVEMLDEIEKVIIVCADNYRASINLMLDQYGIHKSIEYAVSGNSRQASVLSGLKLVKTENVIIHEAARPFVSIEDYQELINADNKNTVIGIDVPFTVLKGHDNIEGLFDRSELVNVQLPQKFDTQQLLEAHKKAESDGKLFTEDASLLYYYNPGIKIKIIKGKDYNVKITTRMDMITGEIIYDEVFRRRK